MPTVSLEWDSAKLNRIERQLTQLFNRLQPRGIARFLEEDAAPYIQKRAAARFASEGDAASGKWKPLTEGTQGIREVLAQRYGWSIFPAHPINQRTGVLRNIVIGTSTTVMVPAGAAIDFPRHGLGAEAEKKFWHAQRGGETARGTAFPARPVLAVDAVDATFLTNAANRYLVDMLSVA